MSTLYASGESFTLGGVPVASVGVFLTYFASSAKQQEKCQKSSGPSNQYGHRLSESTYSDVLYEESV